MNKQQIAQVLRDYFWMLKEIERLRNELREVETVGVGQYGLQAAMPHSGEVSDPISKEVVRREKKSNRQIRLEDKVMYIQDRLNRITDEREIAVLDCMLDGWSIRKIAFHMGLSHTHIRKIIDDITNELAG